MVKIQKDKLQELLSLLGKERDIFLPVRNAGQTSFALWTPAAEVDFHTLKTIKSPKDVFFPQSETLYTCVKKEGRTHITPGEIKDRDFILFGIKMCDYKGIEVLDKVFLCRPVDSFYKERREHGLIVCLACNEPEESCFCSAFGTDALAPEGDVAMWQSEENFYMDARTDRGAAFLDEIKDLVSVCDGDDETVLSEIKSFASGIIQKLPYGNLSLQGWKEKTLTEIFDSSLWQQLSKTCLGCGSCTFLCPACQCYDIKDYNTGHGVQHYRCWDSCMYSDFTMMAHGNNRTEQYQRFRQRFMHKLVYFPENNEGMYGCVGCGRCVEKCPSGLNIVKVIKALEEEGKTDK